MVLGSLRGASLREHSNYIGSRTCPPLRPPGRQTRTRAEKPFAELRPAVPKLEKQSARHNLWISAETWRLVDERVSTRRDPGRDQQHLRQLGRAIRVALKEDMQRRVTPAEEAAESMLTGTPPDHAKIGGVCGGGTKKRWITPSRPPGSQSSGSRRIARSYTVP